MFNRTLMVALGLLVVPATAIGQEADSDEAKQAKEEAPEAPEAPEGEAAPGSEAAGVPAADGATAPPARTDASRTRGAGTEAAASEAAGTEAAASEAAGTKAAGTEAAASEAAGTEAAASEAAAPATEATTTAPAWQWPASAQEPSPATAPPAAAPVRSAPPASAPPAAEPAPAPSQDPPQTSRRQAHRDHKRSWRSKMLEHRRNAPIKYMALTLGPTGTQLTDPGFANWFDQERFDGFRWSLDVYPHPNFAVTVAGTTGLELTASISEPDESGSLSLVLSPVSLDVGAKGILAPAYYPLRPFARVAGGAHIVRAELQSNESGRMARRTYVGAAPLVRLGGGIEVTTPRMLKSGSMPWGIGFTIEGGATLGGGGEQPAVPGVKLGELGTLDIGPGYARGGVVLLF